MFVSVLLSITLCPFWLCNHLNRKRKLVALLLLSYRCSVSINIVLLFLTVPWFGLQYLIMIFPDNTHLFFVGWLLYSN